VEIAPLASTNEALIVFSIRDAVDVLIKVAALSADPRVIFAQPDYLFETRAGQVAFARGLMHVDQLHPSVTGNGVSVTVIDSGVDASITADRADFTGTGLTSDLHGTLMAGMIRETAPRAGILAHKACVPVSPQSMQARCAATALSKALDKAVQRRSHVINMSVAGPKERLVTRLVEAAVASGAVVLAAVGNLGPKGDVGYPAALDNVIAVTAVDAREEVYRYATPGPFTDIAAPGVEVLGQIPGKQQVFVSGTSAATAYSSGVAALLLQQKPGISPAALQSLLEGSAKELGATGKDIHFGSGLIDACRATSCR
jgi:subtilisin family serine protease